MKQLLLVLLATALGVTTARSQSSSPLGGTYTIDRTQPAGPNNFPSFTAAIQALRAGNTAAPVTFNVAAGQTFAENPPSIPHGNRHPVTFRKAGAGPNPVLTPASSMSAFLIDGADYITFDGIDVTASNSRYGYYITNYAYTDGARYISVKNATITLSQSVPGSTGIYQTSSTLNFRDTLAPNAHTRYESLLIRQATSGIQVLADWDQGLPDYDVEVARVTVGDGTPRNIGYLTGGVEVNGMNFREVRGLRLHHCLIQGLSGRNTAVTGLMLNPVGGNVTVAHNRIRDVEFQHPGSSVTSFGVSIAGLYVGMSSFGFAPVAHISVHNNEVQGLRHTSPAAPTLRGNAVGLQFSIGSRPPSSLRIAHNTVQVSTAPWANFSSGALSVNLSTDPSFPLQVRNNLLVNQSTTVGSSATSHVVAGLNIPAGQTPSTMTGINWNHNALVTSPQAVAGAVFVPGAAIQAFPNQADWQIGTGFDATGGNANPHFAAGADLVPTNLALDNLGTPIGDIGTDLTDAPRSRTRPDVGAYEFSGVLSNHPMRRTALGLHAYPIPFGATLTVQLAHPLRTAATLELLDATGRPVRRADLAPGIPHLRLSALADLPPGLYGLRLVTADGQQQTLPLLH